MLESDRVWSFFETWCINTKEMMMTKTAAHTGYLRLEPTNYRPLQRVSES